MLVVGHLAYIFLTWSGKAKYNWNISSLARYGKASFVFFLHSQSRLPHPFSSSYHLLTLYKLFILCVSFIIVHLCKSCVQIYGVVTTSVQSFWYLVVYLSAKRLVVITLYFLGKWHRSLGVGCDGLNEDVIYFMNVVSLDDSIICVCAISVWE